MMKSTGKLVLLIFIINVKFAIGEFIPLGSLPHNNSALVSSYYLNKAPTPWESAYTSCLTTFLAGLVEVDSEEENAFLKLMLANQAYLNQPLWTAGIYDPSSSMYVWSGSGSIVELPNTYTTWGVGSPLVIDGHALNVRYTFVGSTSVWATMPGSSDHAYICEITRSYP